MIGILKKRKLRKQLKEYLHAARHARHMREDIAPPEYLEALKKAEAEVREIRRTGEGNVEKAVEQLSTLADKVYPSANNSGIRENVEVIIVALAAAMAIRAFFVEPFKIPTGSMQPTLNGIKTEEQVGPGLLDHQPLKLVKWFVTGESYKEIKAKQSGQLVADGETDDVVYMRIGTWSFKVSKLKYKYRDLQVGTFYKKGEIILSNQAIAGDHILVNKMKYNFMRPDRGDISVFDTRHLEGVRTGSFYIKRMVGLAGEKIQIQNGRIVADGEIVREPAMFETIATDPAYSGHAPMWRLAKADDFMQLQDEYLMMGDNTHNSLDGRYFGGVPREDFRGPAFFVYWPFREHWGIVR
jgi:signal peptidase I